MKLPTINTRLLTPPVSPDLNVQKKLKKAEQDAKLASALPGSGGRGGSGAASIDVPSFDSFYEQASAYYTPATIDYTPLDKDTIASLIAEWLRPTYDRAIANRREATRAYNANLDADAWARGLGRSSYVTDVKGRNYGDESRDVSTLESSYGSVLAEHLYDALKTQAEKKLEVDTFNAEQINTARARAFDAATALYNAAQTAAIEAAKLNGSSGGGGSTAKKTQSAALSAPTTTIKETLKSSLTTAPVYNKVQTTSPKTVEKVLSRLSGSERDKLYQAKTKTAAKMLTEMTKSVGKNAMNQLMQRYAATK